MTSEKTHEQYMRKAIELASSEIHRREGRPFGAVIVNGDQVVGWGTNRALLDNDPTAHAEIVAIRDACRRLQSYKLSGSVLYSSCEPCPMCLSALYWAGIKELYFGCSSQTAEQFGFGDSWLYQEICGGCESRQVKAIQLLESEALLGMVKWIESGGTAYSLADWKKTHQP